MQAILMKPKSPPQSTCDWRKRGQKQWKITWEITIVTSKSLLGKTSRNVIRNLSISNPLSHMRLSSSLSQVLWLQALRSSCCLTTISRLICLMTRTTRSMWSTYKNHLLYNDVTAKYRICLSLTMLFFVRIKGCVNCCKTTSVHKKARIHALICLVTGSVFWKRPHRFQIKLLLVF